MSTLGPFQIADFLARGGMGAVYHGRHVTEGFDAAIKVVRAEHATSAMAAAAFVREVQAAASLSHPAIVRVWDYGRVTTEEAAGADEAHGFTAGSPWYAMEYAPLGTLEGVDHIESFATLRAVLLGILDGLAHAHARGLIHRDLKPANVLLAEDAGRQRLLLADFGIAHALAQHAAHTHEVASPSAGTPLYMAPEQIRGQWRDYGPATDLYALGCIGWELTTGKPPHDGQNPFDIGISHLTREVDAFVPAFEVPDGFEDWLRRLLRKPYWERFGRAADAAWALMALEEGDDAREPSALRLRGVNPHAPTMTHGLDALTILDDHVTPTRLLPSLELQAVRADDAALRVSDLPRHQLPPLPPDWRSARSEGLRSRQGIGLFGLREIPLVGREEERDSMWAALREAAAEGSPRVVLLRGRAGTGKSKLVEWFLTRAHEVGAAAVMRAYHANIAGAGDGLPRMVARYFRTLGLTRKETFEQLTTRMRLAFGSDVPEEEIVRMAAAMTELVEPAPPDADDGVPHAQFGSPAERYGVVARGMEAASRVRPSIMAVDDAHWGFDSLGFVEHVLDRHTPWFPIVLVLAIRPEELDERPLERRRILALLRDERVTVLDLGPLPRRDHRQLVDEFVGLEPSLADRLVEASGDEPLYTENVIADWVQRRSLVPGPNGYVLRDSGERELPRDVEDACEVRLTRLSSTFPIPAKTFLALQVAAALGERVDTSEWERVCEALGVAIPAGLQARLVDAGVAREEGDGWSFSQSVLRDVLARTAQRENKWTQIHAACAESVTAWTNNGSCPLERRARHFLAARRVPEALTHFERAIEGRLVASAYDEAIVLSELHRRVAEEQQIDEADDSVVRVRAMHCDALRFANRMDEAATKADELQRIADRSASILARAEALRVKAGLEHRLGRARLGIEYYTKAIGYYEQVDGRLGITRCAHGRGWLHLNVGEFAEGLDDFRLSTRVARDLNAERDLGWALHGFSEALLRMERFAEGRRAAEESLRVFRSIGSRSGEGMALTTLGSLYLQSGEGERGDSHHRAAVNIFSSIDSPLVAFPLLHALHAAIMRSDVAGAARVMAVATQPVLEEMPAVFRLGMEFGNVYLAAERGDDAALEEALDALADATTGDFLGVHPVMTELAPRIRPSVARHGEEALARFDRAVRPALESLRRGQSTFVRASN